MAKSSEQKQRLIDELSSARAYILEEALILREKCDFGRRASRIWKRYPWIGVGAAGSIGWLLSRLPARKKTIYVYTPSEQGDREIIYGKAAEPRKRASAILRHLWSIAKWLLTGYLGRKLFQN